MRSAMGIHVVHVWSVTAKRIAPRGKSNLLSKHQFLFPLLFAIRYLLPDDERNHVGPDWLSEILSVGEQKVYTPIFALVYVYHFFNAVSIARVITLY